MNVALSMLIRVLLGVMALLGAATFAAVLGACALWLILEIGDRVIDHIMHEREDEDDE